MTPPVLLVCHSTRPRGGLVHTLSLGEALVAQGADVRLVTLGDPTAGLFRSTPLPHTIVAAPPSADTLEERVFAAVDALEAGLAVLLPPGPTVLHAQDCIAARAACRSASSCLRCCNAAASFASTSCAKRAFTN